MNNIFRTIILCCSITSMACAAVLTTPPGAWAGATVEQAETAISDAEFLRVKAESLGAANPANTKIYRVAARYLGTARIEFNLKKNYDNAVRLANQSRDKFITLYSPESTMRPPAGARTITMNDAKERLGQAADNFAPATTRIRSGTIPAKEFETLNNRYKKGIILYDDAMLAFKYGNYYACFVWATLASGQFESVK